MLEFEEHDGLYSPTQVTVIGKGYKGRVVSQPARPGHYIMGGRTWVPAQPAHSYISGRNEMAVEVTESLSPKGGPHVEERIEINDYPITPRLAQAIARERLGRALVSAITGTYQGPAEGRQNYAPLTHRILNINRSLTWNGSAYRYEMTVLAPRVGTTWDGVLSDSGWW